MTERSDTITAAPVNAGELPSALLTVVVGYDDLCADDARSIPALRGRSGELRIGRSPTERVIAGGALLLADGRVSGEHAILRRRTIDAPGGARGEARVVDTIEELGKGSKNGTFVNGDRLPVGERRELADGDLVEVGHTLLCYRRTSEELAVRLAETDVAGVAFGLSRTFCPAVARCADDLAQLASTDARALIHGETGVGKEAAARALHDGSRRSGRPYVIVNCPAIPTDLFEGELFGKQKGAYTGALESTTGRLAEAEGGTIFLDEIGSLALAHQAKLLRVIETGTFRRLGASHDARVDVRWVAATNEDVSARLRLDILHRIAQHTCVIPPLRERREDLGVLLAYALRDVTRKGCTVAITSGAARALFFRRFSGNLRELVSVVRAAAHRAGADRELRCTIDLEHLPPENATAAPPSPPAEVRAADTPADGAWSEPEVRAALEGRSKVDAARLLGISARHLDRLLVKLGVAGEFRRR